MVALFNILDQHLTCIVSDFSTSSSDDPTVVFYRVQNAQMSSAVPNVITEGIQDSQGLNSDPPEITKSIADSQMSANNLNVITENVQDSQALNDGSNLIMKNLLDSQMSANSPHVITECVQDSQLADYGRNVIVESGQDSRSLRIGPSRIIENTQNVTSEILQDPQLSNSGPNVIAESIQDTQVFSSTPSVPILAGDSVSDSETQTGNSQSRVVSLVMPDGKLIQQQVVDMSSVPGAYNEGPLMFQVLEPHTQDTLQTMTQGENEIVSSSDSVAEMRQASAPVSTSEQTVASNSQTIGIPNTKKIAYQGDLNTSQSNSKPGRTKQPFLIKPTVNMYDSNSEVTDNEITHVEASTASTSEQEIEYEQFSFVQVVDDQTMDQGEQTVEEDAHVLDINEQTTEEVRNAMDIPPAQSIKERESAVGVNDQTVQEIEPMESEMMEEVCEQTATENEQVIFDKYLYPRIQPGSTYPSK